MRNSLENALDNIDTSTDDVVMLSCSPFDELYEEDGISVTVCCSGGKMQVAVGFEGSSDVVTEAALPLAAGAAATMAAAVADAIDKIQAAC